MFKCPVCGAPNGTCTDGPPIPDPVGMEDLDPMAPRGSETPKMRMPQQKVRAGRGVPGYTGNVETYDPNPEPQPEKVKRISGEQKQREPKENK